MRILHLLDSPATGGATVAAESVIAQVGGRAWRRSEPTRAERAIHTVAGFCGPTERRRIRRAIERECPDVVHLHNIKETGTAAIAACLDLGVPTVWSCYDYWCLCPRSTSACDVCGPGGCSVRRYRPASGSIPWVARLALLGRQRRLVRWLDRVDAIACLSRDSALRLRRAGIASPAQHVVPLPVTVPSMAVRPRSGVLFLGGFRGAHKGGEVWQATARILQQARPGLLCKALYDVPRERVLREIAGAACVVCMELWPNPGPIVVAEAQLLGTPVVASRTGGIPEMHPTALAEPGDPEDFAAKVLGVLYHGGGAETSMDAARERHDPDRIGAQLQRIYEAGGQGCDHA